MAVTDPLGLVGTEIGEGLRVLAAERRGTMSLVYRTIHPASAEQLAFKVYLGLADLPAPLREGFVDHIQEVSRVVGYLSTLQPAFVRVVGVGSQPLPDGVTVPCTLMEWVEGVSLEDVLDVERTRGLYTRSASEVFALMREPMAALAAAHQHGIVHRDLKPGNFFVQGGALEPGALKLLDFSFAKRKSPLDDEALQSVAFLTPDYAAPEQYRRNPAAIGPWTDVFGLALVMVELMLGGRPALQGDDLDAVRRASEDPRNRPTPRSFGIEVPNAVEAVFKRALAVRPRDRFVTVEDFGDALQSAIENEDRITSSRISRVAGFFDMDPTPQTRRARLFHGPSGPEGPAVVARENTEVTSLPPVLDVRLLGPARTGDTVVANRSPSRTGHTVRVLYPSKS